MSTFTAGPIVREPMSLEEFFAIDVVLAELVDGQPVFMSSPIGRHQHLVAQIMFALEARRLEGTASGQPETNATTSPDSSTRCQPSLRDRETS